MGPPASRRQSKRDSSPASSVRRPRGCCQRKVGRIPLLADARSALDGGGGSPYIHEPVEMIGHRTPDPRAEVLRVASLRLVPPPRLPQLFASLRFDTALESGAFRQLATLDVEGCRTTFGQLVDQLDTAAPGVSDREVVGLLLDILQRVNRRLHRPPDGELAALENRASLLTQFATVETAEQARQAFLPALTRLLSVFHAGAASHPLVEQARNYIEENYQRRLS